MRKYYSGFATALRKTWDKGGLPKVRLIAAAILMGFAGVGFLASLFFTMPIAFNAVSVGMSVINLVLMFWTTLYGRTFPLFHLNHTKLDVEDGAKLAEAHTDNGVWYYYRLKPEVAEWCRSCLGHRYGVVPKIDPFHGRTAERTFWFASPDDAFAFKMRWVGGL